MNREQVGPQVWSQVATRIWRRVEEPVEDLAQKQIDEFYKRMDQVRIREIEWAVRNEVEEAVA